jgi:hypothetical protein
MALRTLYDTPTLTISHEYVENWLQLDWHGSPNDAEVMEGALQLLELLRQERCTKVLNDNTHIQGLWAEAARWGGEVFFPQLYEAGCRYFAWIHSPERYSQLSAELAVQHTSAGILFLTFNSPTSASDWLRQV